MMWVGVWDVVDYHVLPTMTTACAAPAGANPSPAELFRFPSCACVKLACFVLGVIGLWATRTLYGKTTVHSAQHQRAQ